MKKSSLFNLYSFKPEWIIGLIILLGSWASLAQTPINDPNDGKCHFSVQYLDNNNNRKVAPRTVCQNSIWRYTIGGWRPTDIGVTGFAPCWVWNWKFKGAIRWKMGENGTWNDVNPTEDTEIPYECSTPLFLQWGGAPPNQSYSPFVEVVFGPNILYNQHMAWDPSVPSNDPGQPVCNGGYSVTIGLFQPTIRFRSDIFINPSNTQTEDWYFVNGNTTNCGAFSPLLFKYLGAHDFEQYSYQLSQDALDNGYYLDPVPNEKEVYIKNNGTPIAGTYTINYSMIKGCASGLVQVTSAKQFVVNTSTVNAPVINQEEICSFSTVLVHTGSQNGPETGYQGSEFEIESGTVPVFSLNGEKTIVRNEGNAPIWIGSAPEGSTFRVRVRKIYTCGTSPWSPYSTFKVNYYTPVALKRLSNETFVCRNDIFEVGLEMPVADSELPSNVTYDFEVVSSAAQIRDGVSGSLGSLVTQTTNKFVTVNTENISSNNNTPVIIRARANYVCRSTSWVTCTLQVGGTPPTHIGHINLFSPPEAPFCYDNMTFELAGLDINDYAATKWRFWVSETVSPDMADELRVNEIVDLGFPKGSKQRLIRPSIITDIIRYIRVECDVQRCLNSDELLITRTFSVNGVDCSSTNNPSIAGNCILPLLSPMWNCSQIEEPEVGGKNLLNSVKGSNLLNLLSLYPNPANERVFVKGLSSSFDYQILNSLGQVMQTGNSEGEISLGKLPAGTYLLRTTQNSQTLTQRFVKL